MLSLLVVLVMLGILALAYIGIILYSAKKDTASAPKREMFLCDVHGPIPPAATLTLFNGTEFDQEFSDGRTIRGPVRGCPLCFEDDVKKAKHG